MIKYSFESPLQLLNASIEYNDYEYALVHLFDKYPQYLEFYENTILDRPMYLDNSAYELGESFNPEEFAKWCQRFADIKADNLYYFVPDYPQNPQRSIEAVEDFPVIEGATRIGIIHGFNSEEYIASYKAIQDHVDMIAIPMIKYNYNGADHLDLMERTRQRIYLVKALNALMECGYLKRKRIHLLGCLVPQEFIEYPGGMVYSADTSNPIIHGIEGYKYHRYGMHYKSPTKMHDIMEIKLTKKQIKDIYYNLNDFFIMNEVDREIGEKEEFTLTDDFKDLSNYEGI